MRRFCAECGSARLEPWFERVRRIDFPNRLVFTAEHCGDLLRFVGFKLPQLLPRCRGGTAAVRRRLDAKLSAALAQCGRVVIEKDDAIFQCRRPRCP
jgi:hypothetical protein